MEQILSQIHTFYRKKYFFPIHQEKVFENEFFLIKISEYLEKNDLICFLTVNSLMNKKIKFDA